MKGGELPWDYPRAPDTEPHRCGKKQRRRNELEEGTMCCHGQHATTMGARCTTETRKPQDGFPKTDLGLCHQYRYHTGTTKEQRKRHGHSMTWYECYDDKCLVHVQEKIKAGYYPQENGERKPLSKWHRRHSEPEQ